MQKRIKEYKKMIKQAQDTAKDINLEMITNLKRLEIVRDDKMLKPLADHIVKRLNELQSSADICKALEESLKETLNRMKGKM